MSWALLQTRRFARQYKKLPDNTAGDVDVAIDAIKQHPQGGARKKGDLAALYVHKFHSGGLLYRLGYTLDDGVCLIYLEAVGHMRTFTAI